MPNPEQVLLLLFWSHGKIPVQGSIDGNAHHIPPSSERHLYLSSILDSYSLQDVWNLGRLLLIDSFSSPVADEEYHEVDSRLQKSIATDRKRLRQSGAMEALIKANVKGQACEPVSTYAKEMRKAVKTIRVRYAGVTIRRTPRSVDYAGQRISGLEPFMEHFIRVSLYPHEMANLESVAQDLIEGSRHKRA